MSQKRYFEFEADDATIDFNNWHLGILDPGLYRGFDFAPTADLNLYFHSAG